MSSPISGRRRNREQMDAGAGAPPAAQATTAEVGPRIQPRQSQNRTVAERYERIVRIFGLFPESNDHHGRRRRNRARVAASSDAVVVALREATAGDAGAPEECAVCLSDFAAGDRLRAMPCSHAFHQDCIFRWLEVNHVCPLCRHALPTTQQQDGDEDEGPGYEEDDDGDAGEYLLDRDDDYYVNQPDYYDYYFNDHDDGGEHRREVERLVLQLRRQHQGGLLQLGD